MVKAGSVILVVIRSVTHLLPSCSPSCLRTYFALLRDPKVRWPLTEGCEAKCSVASSGSERATLRNSHSLHLKNSIPRWVIPTSVPSFT